MRYLLLLGLAIFSAVSALEKDKSCACPFIWKPVCGNDGLTYPSECILNCVKLKLKPELELAHQGACKHDLRAAQEEEVQGWERGCSCPMIRSPVCGNDGRTYPNKCILNCVRLDSKPDLRLARYGACDQQPLEAAHEEEVQVLKGNPCECPRSLHRVCGSDGNTYSNPCTLNCAKHEGNPDLVQVHEGPCDEHDHDFEDPCKCDNKFEPVCGDDEITYMNLCHLECAAFTTSPGVEMAYEGECHAEINNAMQILLEGNPCECPRSLHRVCGSDGNTYSNPCMLNCAKHNGNPDLVQVHEGPCDEHDHDFEDPCKCDDKFEPVCGDDEITYRNLCHLECAAFTTSPGVEVKHVGECHPEVKVNQLTLKSCVCPKIYLPVCGTDGQTYSNLCVLKCHISSNPGLDLAYLGKCVDAVQAIETEEVRDPCACFRNFIPVCGTDGKTYGNPCMLGCAAATKVPGLKLLHNGRCAPKEQN